jgi:hypothetical protein
MTLLRTRDKARRDPRRTLCAMWHWRNKAKRSLCHLPAAHAFWGEEALPSLGAGPPSTDAPTIAQRCPLARSGCSGIPAGRPGGREPRQCHPVGEWRVSTPFRGVEERPPTQRLALPREPSPRASLAGLGGCSWTATEMDLTLGPLTTLTGNSHQLGRGCRGGARSRCTVG